MRLLAVGTAVRHIAQSASEFADVVAVDEFCDLDTQRYAEECFRVDEVTPASVEEILDDVDYDHAVTTSPNVPTALDLLGNSVEEMRRAGDKLRFARYCEENGIPHPKTSTEPSEETPLEKPRLAGGGVNNRVVDDGEAAPGRVYQEILGGDVLSVSLVSDGEEVKPVAVNRSLVDVEECSPPNRFAYCGNLTPADHPFSEDAAAKAKRIVEDLGLKGLVGVDFIVDGGEAVVLEVNPRIQASLDTVEAAHGVNVVEKHLAAARREPGWGDDLSPFDPEAAACRLVLYAPRNLEVPPLSVEGLRDSPPSGRRVEEGEPVCSVLRKAENSDEALHEAKEGARAVYSEIGDESW